jgi:ABC-type multidrug transport system ATPase subunit
MRITFSDAGKRFNRDWIFRGFNYEFLPTHKYAITGPNGSGKSTLLQVISSNMAVNAGKVDWQLNHTSLDTESIFQHISIAAPYLEVIEEMTATEFLVFHHQFKSLLPGISVKEIISTIGLEKAAHKQIRYYSSGMKQRIKLAQAIFSDVPLLLLDEPCTNLDLSGYELYNSLIGTYCSNKMIIVSSNDPGEYAFCDHKISIMDYKAVRQ